MLDIVILSVPSSLSVYPPAAPALLKASVESAGFTCKTVDYNLQFYNQTPDREIIESYFATGINVEVEHTASMLVKSWVEDLLALNPKFVGISVFTYQNRIATKLFCQWLRKLSTVKIVLGGQGLSDGGILGTSKFARELHNEKLIDFWIRSEGEISLVELLKNNINYPGINSDTFQQIDDLDNLPYPNYDDYKLDQYKESVLPITGSRGCVRSCSFCDIHDHWKYRYRSGQNLVEEMLYLHKKYSINKFNFSDSLINGNLKEFKKFISILAEYNTTIDNPIKWTSQFIIRSSSQLDEYYWKNIAQSGGHKLSIGIETGSDRVRSHMQKKFSNKDIDYTFNMCEKYGITVSMLLIVGYPTETEEDFQETLDMFSKYKYLANSIIVNVTPGSTLSILPGTPLFHNSQEIGLELDKYEHNWTVSINPELTIEQRLSRRQRLIQHLNELGYPISNDEHQMIKILENNLPLFNKRLSIKKTITIKKQ